MRKEHLKEGLGDLAQRAEMDHEVQMARADLYKIAKYAIQLHDMLKSVSEAEGLQGWQQAKITKAADYIGSVYHNLEYDMKFGNGGSIDTNIATESSYKQSLSKKLSERAESKAQRRAAAIALQHKKDGTTPEAGTASAEMMSMSISDLEDFARGSEKGLPNKAN